MYIPIAVSGEQVFVDQGREILGNPLSEGLALLSCPEILTEHVKVLVLFFCFDMLRKMVKHPAPLGRPPVLIVPAWWKCPPFCPRANLAFYNPIIHLNLLLYSKTF